MNTQNLDSTIRILIVDPDLEFGSVLAENMRKAGLEHVVFVDSTDDAIELLKLEEFHVVLSSDKFQEKTGLEFAHEVRKNHAAKPEIIMMTENHAFPLLEAHQVGASYLVSKPINMSQLCSVLTRVGPTEKRTSERVNIDPITMGHLYGQVSPVGRKEPVKVEISNMGRGGFFYKCEISKLPKAGDMLEFEIKLTMVPNYAFTGKGIVRWVRKSGVESGAGVEFLSLEEETAKLISAFVDLFKVKPFVPDQS